MLSHSCEGGDAVKGLSLANVLLPLQFDTITANILISSSVPKILCCNVALSRDVQSSLTLQSDSSSIKTLLITEFYVELMIKMTLKKKLRNTLKYGKNEKGQLSIFLGMTLLIVVTLLAFITNVGLFVKAKINLQNAVDAAAWSGASVQSRQLSNISHLNWEMRNTYKEWMFKYYVLGQMGLEKLRPGAVTPGANMDFKLDKFPGATDGDPFNLPSICIHFGQSNNICKLYSVPGLPRFETTNLISVAEQHESFLNAIVATKAQDCSVRSKLNFGTAVNWAFGTKGIPFSDIPLVASDRVGAWTQNFELALRMRNLEMIMNRPPVDRPICLQGAGAACETVQDLQSSSGKLQINERPIKAFMAAYRNLGGLGVKDGAAIDDPFIKTFTITEIPPKPLQTTSAGLNGFLIPSGHDANNKYYLDLIAYPLNLVTFYTSFVTNNDPGTLPGMGVSTEANCGATKTALPVPGYIFGFVKNPEVLTYYAVKGSAKFVGLFFPFMDEDGIELKTYAVAKPFGGRVGPMLFGLNSRSNPATIVPRNNTRQKRSSPYVMGLDTTGISAGLPIPIIPSSPDFWVASNVHNIGGNPLTASTELRFAVPNLLYDYSNFSDLDDQANSPSGDIMTIREGAAAAGLETMGLYNSNQFLPFTSHLDVGAGSAVLSSEQILRSIESVRRPTRYEALNYLIPRHEAAPESNPEQLDAMPTVFPSGTSPETGTMMYSLYAPLFGPETLYASPSVVKTQAGTYITSMDNAITDFLGALEEVATQIVTASGSTTGGAATYQEAASTIWTSSYTTMDTSACDKASVASKYHQFFKGTGNPCGIIPLDQLIESYVSDSNAASPDPMHPFDTYFRTTYVKPDVPVGGSSPQGPLTNAELSTAYMPGPRQGATDEGILSHPFTPSANDKKGKRNFYSTKFVGLKSVLSSGAEGFKAKAVYSEAEKLQKPDDIADRVLQNSISPSSVSEFGNMLEF